MRQRNPLLDKLAGSALARRLSSSLSWIAGGRLGKYLGLALARARQWGLIESFNRFVLTIGDEGATLVQVRGREAVDAMFVAADAEDGLSQLRDVLTSDTRAVILVMADVLEQMYREEQMPKVNRLDRGNILRRRLDIAFPHDRLKAALPLADPTKAIFASLPETEAIGKWIAFLESLPNPVVGFCLLPLESSNIPALLGPSIAGETRQVWRVLVSQQATSGFRQIFESNGKMVVTRLTQKSGVDLSHEAIAQLIERELRSSISYVKRLGYSDQDRLDLVVLGEPEVCQAVQERDLPVASLTAYTPYQAGLLLGLGTVAPEVGGLSDVLHALWLTIKRKPALSLPTPLLNERLLHDRIFRIGFVAAVALSLFVIGDVASLALDAVDTSTTTDVLEHQLDGERRATTTTKARLASFDVPLDDVLLVDGTAKNIAAGAIDPAVLLDKVATVLEPGMAAQKLEFKVPSLAGPQGAPTPPPAIRVGRGAPKGGGDVLYQLSLSVRFTPNPDHPEGVLQQAKDLRERLAKLLPDHEISTVTLPVNPLRSQIIEGTAGQAAAASGPPVAEYLIVKKG